MAKAMVTTLRREPQDNHMTNTPREHTQTQDSVIALLFSRVFLLPIGFLSCLRPVQGLTACGASVGRRRYYLCRNWPDGVQMEIPLRKCDDDRLLFKSVRNHQA